MQHPLSFMQRKATSDEWRNLVDAEMHDVVVASQLLIDKELDAAKSLCRRLYESSDNVTSFYGALLLHKAASVQHDYSESDKWLAIAERLLPQDDQTSYAFFLNRLGTVHSRKGQLHESIEVHTRAQKIFDEVGLSLESALAQAAIGQALMVMGDAAGAVDMLLQSFPIIEREAPASNANLLRANVASALQRTGNQELARTMYLESLALYPFTSQGNARATVLHNLAIIEKETGNVEQALRYYDMAMETALAAGLIERRVRLAAGKSELLTRCNRTSEAIDLMDSITEREITACTPIAAFDVYAVRSRIHVAENDWAAAEYWFEAAMRIARDNSFNHERSSLLKEYLTLVPLEVNSPQRLKLTTELAEVLEHRLHEMSTSITKSVDMRMAYERSLRAIESEREKEKTDIMLEAADQTTRAIANDLHDEVGQSVAIVGLALDRMILGPDSQPLETDLQFVRNQVESIGKTLRRLTHSLGAVVLENDGLGAAIHELATSIKIAAPQINVECSVIGNLTWLDMPRAKCLYRAAQTFVANSIKHGRPSSIELQLVGTEDEAVLSVEDDGVGFDPTIIRVGLGLRDVKLRVERFGGDIDIDSTLGKGAFISIRIPHV